MADMLAFMAVSLHDLTMNEQEPQLPPQDLVYVDVLEELQYGDFFGAIAQIESKMDQTNDAQSKAWYRSVLEDLFGLEYQGGVCNVLAESYQMQEDGYLTARSSLFHEEGVIYSGITIEAIDNEERVLAVYWDPETEVEFFVLPESMLQLEIKETAVQEGISDILAQYADGVKRAVSSADFLNAPYVAQQNELEMKLLYIESDLNNYANDGPVELDCEGYYLIPDIHTTISLDDAYMDQSNSKRIMAFRPSGRLVGCALLEQLDGREFETFTASPAPYRQFDEFSRSGGIPCVILRDDAVNAVYIVQLDKIRDVICLDGAGPDEDVNTDE